MAHTTVNFCMDESLKRRMKQMCKDMGMITTFTIFATKIYKERRIPFEVAADPNLFYSGANIN